MSGAVSLGAGTMIAAGVFVLSGLAVARVGFMAVVSFLLAAIIASFTAATYAELSSTYPVDGGGYAFVDEVFDTDLTYFAGWCMIMGYPASAAFYLGSLSSWSYRFLLPVFDRTGTLPYWISGLVIGGILMGVNLAGTEESTEFQMVVTALKIMLLLVFIVGGFQAFDPEPLFASAREHATQFRQIGMTSALVFITFFGFEAIATEAGEIRNPETNIPMSIFISIILVTVLYIFVVLVMVLSVRDQSFLEFLVSKTDLDTLDQGRTFIAEHGEIAMGRVAQYYLGDIGFYLFLVGVLFSMISAANATILAGSRVTYAMARRKQLPEAFSRIHSTFRTPCNAVLFTGGVILLFLVLFTIVLGHPPGGSESNLFSLHLGLESLAHFADFFLLIGLALVNFSLIESRRTAPDIDRPFEVPLYPVVPLIGALTSIGLLFHVQFRSIMLGVLFVLLGALLWPALEQESRSNR